MNKKILTLLAIIIISILVVAVIYIKEKRAAQNPELTKQELQQKFQLIKSQYDKAKELGLDVSEAERLGKQAKQAFDSGDYKKASELVKNTLASLSKAGVPEPSASAVPLPTSSGNSTPTPTKSQATPTPITSGAPQSAIKEEALKKLSQVKVISQYRYVTDGINGRTTDDVIKIFKDTKTDFVFQGMNRQNPCPEKCSDLPKAKQSQCELSGYSYEYFKNAISQIKKEMPDIIFGGGFLAEFLDPASRNEITGKTYTRDELWGMALDPSKWGINKTKDQYQTELAIRFGWTKAGQAYNPKEQMKWYTPDITNPEVKELFLSWAKKQINIGVDSIWIDGLYGQAYLLEGLTGDINSKAVKESYEASSYIIEQIHKYGFSKGKYIYVVSWAVTGDYTILLDAPYPTADLDAVMTTIGAAEISSGKMNEARWNDIIPKIRKRFGNTPIFARIDYGNAGSPLGALSKLSSAKAGQFLETADEYLQQKGIIFIYPIHGGNLGVSGQKGGILSYGKYDWYDSLAPEFDTYNIIKELASEKSGQ